MHEPLKSGAHFGFPWPDGPGNPHENEILTDKVAGLEALGMSPREVPLDGGFGPPKDRRAPSPIAAERSCAAGRPSDRSKRTQRRLARYRVGAEGRISHLKAGLGPPPIPPKGRRSRGRSLLVNAIVHFHAPRDVEQALEMVRDFEKLSRQPESRGPPGALR